MSKRPFANATRCPHCASICTTIRTNQITATYREVIYQCRNEACGFLFTASITPVRTILPSATPNPAVFLPEVKG